MTDSFRTEVLLRSEQTGGRVAVVRNTVPAGWAGPPLHHHAFDEAFYVLDGELTFQVGGRRLTAGPGALAFAPRDVVHTLANHSGGAATYLLVITPGGFEHYFDELAGRPTGKPYPQTTVVGAVLDARAPDGAVPVIDDDGPIRVLLHGEESGGAVGIVDNDVGAGSLGPHLHAHDFDEAFCVLDGSLTFQLGDELVRVAAGEVAFAPRGVPHTFSNRDGGPARFVIVFTEAGFERHFARLAARHAGAEPPEWARQPVPEVVHVGPRIAER
jgi:quercetin dioxygenase-like cupin family protein